MINVVIRVLLAIISMSAAAPIISAMVTDGTTWNCLLICGEEVDPEDWSEPQVLVVTKTYTIYNDNPPPATVSTTCTTTVHYRTIVCDDVSGIPVTHIQIDRIERTCAPHDYLFNPYDEVEKAVKNFMLHKDDPLNIIHEGEENQFLAIGFPECMAVYKCTLPTTKYVSARCGTSCCRQYYVRQKIGCIYKWQWIETRGGLCDWQAAPTLPTVCYGEGSQAPQIVRWCAQGCKPMLQPGNEPGSGGGL